MRTRIRTAAAATALLVALFTGSCGEQTGGTVEYHADWPHYESLENLYSAADLVIEGHVEAPGDVRALQLSSDASDTQVYTVVRVNVTHVYKGTIDVGQSIEVKQLGGEYEDTEYVAEDVTYLADSSSYLMFLETFEDIAPGIPASTLNPLQGQYLLGPAGEPVSLSGNTVEFSAADLELVAEQG